MRSWCRCRRSSTRPPTSSEPPPTVTEAAAVDCVTQLNPGADEAADTGSAAADADSAARRRRRDRAAVAVKSNEAADYTPPGTERDRAADRDVEEMPRVRPGKHADGAGVVGRRRDAHLSECQIAHDAECADLAGEASIVGGRFAAAEGEAGDRLAFAIEHAVEISLGRPIV